MRKRTKVLGRNMCVRANAVLSTPKHLVYLTPSPEVMMATVHLINIHFNMLTIKHSQGEVKH